MRTDSFFDQQRAREVDAITQWHFDSRGVDHRAATAFDGVTIGFHWATVLFVLAQFESAGLHTLAEVRQSDFTRSGIAHVSWS